MYDESIRLLVLPEHDSISVCVDIEDDGLLTLGRRINKRFKKAYMNGYNWDAVIRYYVACADPTLINEVETDPAAGFFAAFTSYNLENLDKMKRFRSHLGDMLADERMLMSFIEQHYDKIEWC